MPAGGSRKGAGRKKVEPEQPAIFEATNTDEAPKKDLATKILAGLGKPNGHKADCGHDYQCECRCKCEECLWKRDAEDEGATGRWTRDRLWSRRNGNPVSIVNHLHDKPIEVSVTHHLADVINKARKRIQK